MRRPLFALAAAAAALIVPLADAGVVRAAVPDGFTDTVISNPAGNPLSSPTDISPLPDGRALVLEKAGAVRVLEVDGTLATADALTLSVCTASEEGLLGAAADPAFATNGFVYLYYSRSTGGCANRVSRFTMSGASINPASEVVLLDNMAITAGNHDGGDLHFGGDGYLYVSVGDAGNPPRNGAQDLSILNGKILRIISSGGVPADNPFVGSANAQSCATAGLTSPTNAVCTEIYAYGLRNPYRFAFDPNSANTQFFVNDVGDGTWEEVDLGVKGANYGWPIREGFCPRGSTSGCGASQYTDPLTAYQHNGNCRFLTAGVFVPNGLWAGYDGSYLFADGGCGNVWRRTAAGAVDYANPFATTSGVIVDMTFLTQGGATALYYVTNSSGQIHRVYLPPPPQFVVPTGRPNAVVVAQLTTDDYEGGNGWTAAYGCADGYRGTSTSNNTDNAVASNLVIVPTDAKGNFCVTAYRPTDIVVDLAGTLPGASIGTPTRVLDTRLTGGRLSASTDRRVRLGPANAMVVAQFTTDNYEGGNGWTAVFACATGYQGTSSLNNTSSAIASNLVLVPTDASGDVCVRAQHATDLAVDVSGTLAGASITTPQRVLDTRLPAGSAPATERVVHVGPASTVVAVQLTTDNYATGSGWTAAFACATGYQNTSSLNNTADPVASNLAIVPTDANGNICVRSYQPTDLVVDLLGTLPGAQIQSPVRIFDTR